MTRGRGLQPLPTGISHRLATILVNAGNSSSDMLPPAWLVAGLRKGICRVRRLRRREASYPTRMQWRVRAEALQAALLVINTESNDPLARQRWKLPLMKITAELEQDRMNIRPGQGAGKPFPKASGVTPRQVCAAWIAVAWREFHHERVGPYSKTAKAACECLWRAAGKSDAADAKWDKHIRAVLAPPGDELASHLTARWGEIELIFVEARNTQN